MTTIHSRPNTTPMPPTMVKTCSQPAATTSQPISGEKAAVAKYCAELKMAAAVPRSLVGNQAATMRELPGNDGPSARPTSNRRMNSRPTAVPIEKFPTKPWQTVKMDQDRIAPQ